MSASTQLRVRFGDFELDLDRGLLLKNGVAVHLAQQPFRALAFLASHPGEVVTRAQLQHVIWGERTHVDFEHGLNMCVRQIRTALGEDAEGARIVVTVPRLGYQFSAPILRDAAIASRKRWVWAAAVVLLALMTYGNRSFAPVNRVSTNQASLDFWGSRASDPAASLRFGPVSPQDGWPTNSPEAYAAYWRGHASYGGAPKGRGSAALPWFERAASLDPEFAQAHAGVAVASASLAFEGMSPSSAAKGRAAGQRALLLNASLPESHIGAAELNYRLDRDFQGAEREFRRAIQLDPKSVLGHQRYAMLLANLRRFDESLEELRVAQSLDPTSVLLSRQSAHVLFLAGRYDECVVQARKSLRLDPSYAWTLHTLGSCYQAKGNMEAAIQAHQRAGRLSIGRLGYGYAMTGRTGEARKLLAELEPNENTRDKISAAMIYVGLGDRDAALAWLTRAYGNGATLPFGLRVSPHWDTLRSDPRFTALLREGPVAGK